MRKLSTKTAMAIFGSRRPIFFDSETVRQRGSASLELAVCASEMSSATMKVLCGSEPKAGACSGQAGTKLTHYMVKDGLVNNFVRAFLQGKDGSIWVATDEGVSHWQDGHFTNYQERDGLCYFSTRTLAEDRNGDIWVGTDRGVSHLQGGRFTKDAVTEALRQEKIWAIREDSDGGLWFGTRTGGLYRWRFGKLTHFTTAQGLASNSIYELVEDRAGNFWISGPNGISVISRRELDIIAEDPSHPLSLTLVWHLRRFGNNPDVRSGEARWSCDLAGRGLVCQQ